MKSLKQHKHNTSTSKKSSWTSLYWLYQTKVFSLTSLQVRLQLPVAGEVKGELREQPELAFDLHPPGAAHVAPGVKPLAHHVLVRRQRLEPQVEDLLIEAEADEAAELHVHLGVHGVVGEVDGLDTSGTVSVVGCSQKSRIWSVFHSFCTNVPVEQLFGRQDFPVLVESECLAKDEATVDGAKVLLDLFGGGLLDEQPRVTRPE